MPEILISNEKIFDCLMLCRSQMRMGFSGPIGFDWNVVEKVARIMDLKIDEEFYRKIEAFEGGMMEETAKDSERLKVKGEK